MPEPLRRIVAADSFIYDTELVSKPIPLVPGATSTSIWVTLDSLPTKDNNKSEDGATRLIDPSENFGLVPALGTNMQATELPPNIQTPLHRTSSLDYNILVEGEVVLLLEDGTEKHLKNPGDTVIMKGGLHAWRNPSKDKTVRWITVLLSAEPVIVGSTVLAPEAR